MKRKAVTGLIAIVSIAAVIIFAGCLDKEEVRPTPLLTTPTYIPKPTVTPTPSLTETPTPTPTPEKPKATPTNAEDNENSDIPVFVWQETIHVRPPFYEGHLPLVVESGKKPIGMNEMITLYHAFDGWTNNFVYNDPALKFSGIPTYARTTDDNGRLLAEAKLLRIIKGEGIEIEETHYKTNGDVRFKCKSQIDFVLGFKTAETDTKGSKAIDYYFIWPVHNY